LSASLHEQGRIDSHREEFGRLKQHQNPEGYAFLLPKTVAEQSVSEDTSLLHGSVAPRQSPFELDADIGHAAHDQQY
jgi:hypothetical protein